MDWDLAQVNVAKLRAPLDDPIVAEFVDNLDRINAVADRSLGFIWRLQTDAGDATAVRAFDDQLVIVNLSVWTGIEPLADYVYRSDHVKFLRRRSEWFDRYGSVHMALWWIPAGTLPCVEEAVARLERLEREGPSPVAFTFRRRFDPSEASLMVRLEGDCPG